MYTTHSDPYLHVNHYLHQTPSMPERTAERIDLPSYCSIYFFYQKSQGMLYCEWCSAEITSEDAYIQQPVHTLRSALCLMPHRTEWAGRFRAGRFPGRIKDCVCVGRFISDSVLHLYSRGACRPSQHMQPSMRASGIGGFPRGAQSTIPMQQSNRQTNRNKGGTQ